MPVVEIYGKHAANNKEVQGGIVAFNLRRSDGSYIGYYEVDLLRNSHVDSNGIGCEEYPHSHGLSL